MKINYKSDFGANWKNLSMDSIVDITKLVLIL